MKEYDRNKELKMGDVHQAFIRYIRYRYRDLTLSERLLIEDLWEQVKSELK